MWSRRGMSVWQNADAEKHYMGAEGWRDWPGIPPIIPHRGINKRVKPLILPARNLATPPVDKAAESLRKHGAPTDVRHRGLPPYGVLSPCISVHMRFHSAAVYQPLRHNEGRTPGLQRRQLRSKAYTSVMRLLIEAVTAPAELTPTTIAIYRILKFEVIFISTFGVCLNFTPKLTIPSASRKCPSRCRTPGIWQGFQPSQ